MSKCPREDDFLMLYDALGDGDAQELVRSSSTNKRHCHWLREFPSACDELPPSAGHDLVGRCCPNNPFSIHKDLVEVIEEHASLLVDAEYLFSMHKLGLTNYDVGIFPEEFLVLTTMQNHSKQLDRKAMSMMFG